MLIRLLLCVVFSLSNAFALDKASLGVQIGSNTGLSSDFEHNGNLYDAALGFSTGGSEKLHIHSSRLFRSADKFKFLGQLVNWYYSLGGRYLSLDNDKEDSSYKLGARGASGFDYIFESSKIKLFLEGAFIFNVLPSTDADVDVLLGGRYYF